MEVVRYRSKESGGLELSHVKSKATATLIKSLIETSSNTKYVKSPYHSALIAWNVFDNRTIPNPGKNPYYSNETYNIIKRAVLEGKEMEAMSGKDWYQFILKSVIEEEEGQLIPCRVELLYPLHYWTRSWARARMKGLSSESMTFLSCHQFYW